MVAPASESIDQRFAQLIQQFGLTKNSFAISLGKTASVVQHLIDGRNKPGYDLLCRVFEVYPNVSRDWLLLGRGPMLVGGEPMLKSPQPASVPAAELPLEPIDLSDVEISPSRRNGSGSGARLQPAEIVATLALAAAANQPARAAAPELNGHAPEPMQSPRPAEETRQPSPQAEMNMPQPVAPAPTPITEQLAPAAPATAVAAPVPSPAPDAYIAAALHAQYLQHQLAMAEMRNQHLVEQQQMLREMLAMARQAMV